MKAYLVRISLCLLTCALAGGLAAARTIEFETTQVTAADVALSPDGQWLIFTMLGHLFQLPVTGGTAEQLTFGPYYDTDPVFSPDGARVAFVSDRDGSEGNVFVLELATGQITQVTHESWAGRPVWTPDGQAIVYLSFMRDPTHFGVPTAMPALVRQLALGGGEPETLSTPPRLFRSVFYLPDGRLAWTVFEGRPAWTVWTGGPVAAPRTTTRVEVMSQDGTVSTLRTIEGIAHRPTASPQGDGLYCRRLPTPRLGGWYPDEEELIFLPLLEGAERHIFAVSGTNGWDWGPRFSVVTDGKSLYLGEAGRLWKIALPDGAREPIPFNAHVKLEIQDPVPPPKWTPREVGSSAPPRSILKPTLSPDGRRLVFGAARYLWQQPLDGGPAERLSEDHAFERDPAFSPDGRQLAFVRFEHGKQEVRVFDFASRKTRTVASGDFYWQLSWSPDGQRLVYLNSDTHRAVAVNLSDGKKEKLAEVGEAWWLARPQLSADGQALYFSADNTFYRLPLRETAKPEPIIQLTRSLSDGLISPDGKWLAFRRWLQIWVVPLGPEPGKEQRARLLSQQGADSFFSFTPDSSAVLYVVGNRVWRHPLAGGEREEIPIRLEFKKPTPPPLLVRRVRVLDFAEGAFGLETSLFIEQGQIRWIGSERGRKLPRQTVILDVGGRFAIPGLFDMHVHGGGANHDAFVAYGVTSVRNLGNEFVWLNAAMDRGEATSEPLPRYFHSGDIFRGPPQIGSLEEARANVPLWKEWGARFIKAYSTTLPQPWHRAVAEEARRLGLPVVGHGANVAEITKSVILGYATLEHAGFRFYDDVLQMLSAAGTRWDPTVGVSGGNKLLLHEEPERLANSRFRSFVAESRILTVKSDSSLWEKRVLPRVFAEQLATIRAAYGRGVKLHVGSDAPDHESFFGLSLHFELEHFIKAGIEPLEVLRIATQRAAEAVGAEHDLGTLEAGKLADLVLLDANPLEDIRNTQAIWRVIKGGWLFDPEKLRPPESASSTN